MAVEHWFPDTKKTVGIVIIALVVVAVAAGTGLLAHPISWVANATQKVFGKTAAPTS